MDIFEKKNCFVEFQDIKSIQKYGDYNNCKDPVISIIMPVYKRPDTFRISLLSAINQSFRQTYEIVVVDNFDGDGESPNLSVVKNVGASNIMYYQNEDNLGMYGNWNRGIELARAKYITYCHDDDMLLPNCLSRLMELQQKTGNKCILSRWNEINEKGELTKEYKYPHKVLHFLKEKDNREYSLYDQFLASVGFGVGCLFDKKCMLEIGGYNKEFYPSADYALQSCYTFYYGCILNNVPTFNYRVGINESFTIYEKFTDVDFMFRDCMKNKISLPKWWLKLLNNAMYNTNKLLRRVKWGNYPQSELKKIRWQDETIVKIAYYSTFLSNYIIQKYK